MDSKAYLRTLGEDELVGLVLDLAARHPAVARELTERAAANQPDEFEWDNEAFNALRGAIFAKDSVAAFQALSGRSLEHVLQFAGDAVLGALTAGLPDAAEVAAQCLSLLRERGNEGDDELIAQLATRVEGAPAPLLRAVPVDMEELSNHIEGNSYQEMYIDLQDGGFWFDETLTGLERPDPENEDRWLFIGSQIGSRGGYDDMVDFTGLVRDNRLRGKLDRALEGKGAFRRFRDELHDASGEVLHRWHVFSDERTRGRARAWLAERGLRPS
jgi:hypothetical protein